MIVATQWILTKAVCKGQSVPTPTKSSSFIPVSRAPVSGQQEKQPSCWLQVLVHHLFPSPVTASCPQTPITGHYKCMRMSELMEIEYGWRLSKVQARSDYIWKKKSMYLKSAVLLLVEKKSLWLQDGGYLGVFL